MNTLAKQTIWLFSFLVCASSGYGDQNPAQRYGVISGRIVLTEAIPALPPLVPEGAHVKDGAVCAAEGIPNERLVWSGATAGVQNVFIYVYKLRKELIHPDLTEPTSKPARLSIRGCRYRPHALCVRTGQHLELTNKDSVSHNPNSCSLRNQGLGSLVTPNSTTSVRHQMREFFPFVMKCDYHPWMSAHILVLDHPYMTVSNSDGKFEIPKLPYGPHELRVWHELKGYILRKDIILNTQSLDLGKIPFQLTLDDKAALGIEQTNDSNH